MAASEAAGVTCMISIGEQDDHVLQLGEGARVKVFADRNDWLTARKNYIGSSDAAAVLGENPYRSAAQVAEDKWGKVDDAEMPIYVRLGKFVEPFIGDEYARSVAGARIAVPPSFFHVVNDRYPYLSATPDFFIYRPECGWGVLECKATGVWDRNDLDRHCIQLQHQMLVTGLSWGVVAWLTFRGKFDFEQFDADPKVQQSMLQGYEDFWTKVLIREVPLTQGHDDTGVMSRIYGLTDDAVALPPEASTLDAQYVSACERIAEMNSQIKALDAEKKEAQSGIMALMKQAGSATLGDVLYTRKTVHRKEYSVAATSYEQFGRKVMKPKTTKGVSVNE